MNATTVENQEPGISSDDGHAGKYLTFVLGPEEYGLEIVKIREIIKVMEITKMPQTPEYVQGVINLRGKVIPVIDLRLKFGMERIEYNQETCIIVLEVDMVTMGVIVDTVSEVVDIGKDQIDPPPAFGSDVDTNFILGMGKIKGEVKILLDVRKILTGDEFKAISGLGDDHA